MKIVGYMVNYRHFKYINDFNWVLWNKMKIGFIQKTMAKFWSLDQTFRLNWYKDKNNWVLSSIMIDKRYVPVEVLVDYMDFDKFSKVNIKILSNKSIIILMIKSGLDPSNIIYQILTNGENI